jgi:hypothetical protein
VVPKHRMSEARLSLAPAQAPLSTADFWSEDVGRRRADTMARRRPAHARALGSPAADRTSSVATGGFAAQESAPQMDDGRWPMGPGEPSWDSWGPPPQMPPDHPSAPVPRIRAEVNYNDPGEYTGPLPRTSGDGRRSTALPRRQPNPPWADAAPNAPASRQAFPAPWAQTGSQGYAAQGYAAQAYGASSQAYAEPTYAQPAYAEPAYGDPQAYVSQELAALPESYEAPQDYADRQGSPAGRHHSGPSAYARPQRQADPRRAPAEPRSYQAARGLLHAVPDGPAGGYQAESAPDVPGSGGWNEAPSPGGPASRAPQGYADLMRDAAEREAEAIRQQAERQAAKLTQEAAQQAAKIRGAAEEEAAKLRAALATMSGEMGRVAAYVTEYLTVPAIPATRPTEAPVTRPAHPRGQPAEAPAARPDRLAPAEAPAARPPRPRTGPDAPPARPPRPRTGPDARPDRPRTAQTRPRTTPGQTTGGRQRKAMRIAAGGTAAMFSIAVLAAAANIAHFGPKFFVFREAGAGETGGSQTDQNFLSQQSAPAKAPAAKAPAQGHTPGKHSAKTTSG